MTTKIVIGLSRNYPNEEKVYHGMIQRCTNPKATGYKYYGGKGVKVQQSWKDSFINFYIDMGARPKGRSLDRIDSTGDYNKGNCRWATLIEQARNTSRNKFIEHDGRRLCLEEWGLLLKIKPNTILTRLRRGWSISESFEKEKRKKAK